MAVMAEQLEKVLSSLGRMENETLKASTLTDVVSDAVFTERLEKIEKHIYELHACIKKVQH